MEKYYQQNVLLEEENIKTKVLTKHFLKYHTLMLVTTLVGRYIYNMYYIYFLNFQLNEEETKLQKKQVTCSKLHSRK